MCKMCVCVCVCVCVHVSYSTETVYELPLLPNNTAVKYFYTNQERCEVLTGYLSLGRRADVEWANTWHWAERFAVCCWNRRRQQPSYCHILFLFAYLEETIIRNMIIIGPITGPRCPEGSRKLRFPDYVTMAQDGGKVVSLTHRPLFTPRKYSWYSFLLEAESTPGP